ncbi:hypothetical protein [Bartonella massiliensis]|uniref:hypothetical protein n=1 Tax=Bartonella massiliensis TaxID=929795 RepID=UPI001157C88C|nr:hypothetical protein [Bartonella massiliensis]
MKGIILIAALFSVFFSVLSPVTVNALPVGNAWGIKRDEVVDKIVKQNDFGDREREILDVIIVPERYNLFSYNPNRFKIEKRDHMILRAMGLRNGCVDLDPREYSGQKWMSCSVNSN